MKRVEKVGRAHPGAPPPHNQRICTSSERAALCLLQRRPAVEPFLLFRKIHLNSRLPPDLFSPSRALLNKRSGRRAAAGASVPCRASPGLRKQAPGTTARVESDRRSSRYWSAALAHSVPSAEGCDPEGNKRTEEEEVGAGVADRKGRAWGSWDGLERRLPVGVVDAGHRRRAFHTGAPYTFRNNRPRRTDPSRRRRDGRGTRAF